MTLATELHGWVTPESEKLFAELTPDPIMRQMGLGIRWVETYAGYSGQSLPLERMWETGVKNGEIIDPEYQVHRSKNGSQLSLWATGKHRLPWQTEQYYDEQREELTPAEFGRMHRLEWAASQAKFIDMAHWSKCRHPHATGANLRGGETIMLGIDGAFYDDYLAIVGIAAHDDPWAADRKGSEPLILPEIVYERVFRPEDYPNGEIDGDDVTAELDSLIAAYDIFRLVFDPNKLETMIQTYRKSNVVDVRKFGQGKERIIADGALHARFRNRRIIHHDQPGVRTAIDNADQKRNEAGLRIVKRNDKLKIDAAIATSMVCQSAANAGFIS